MRALTLASRTVSDVRRILRASGFHELRGRLGAERRPDGDPQWLLSDGEATPEESDSRIVPCVSFLKEHALVEVFPLGDPTRRRGPPLAPFARKYVLFEPFAGASDATEVPRVLLERNRIFAVSDSGAVIPRSRRQHHGGFFDADDLLGSWSFAHTVTTRAVIRLAGREDGWPDARDT